MTVKHTFILFLTLIISAALFSHVFASAEESSEVTVDVPPKITFVGDSIAAGYGLKGFTKKNPYNCDSYANILAEKYKNELEGICPFTMVNGAVSGDKSTDLLEHLKSGVLDNALIGANVVVISIGGNDILKQFRTFMSKKLKLNTKSNLTEVVDQVSDLKGVLDDLSELSDNIDTALNQYETVINEIVNEINSKSDAVIIFQTLYDPFANVPAAFLFQGLSKDKIEKLNTIIKNNAVDENGTEKYLVCDIYEPFFEKGLSLTNMSSLDIHPNADGHALIAEELDKVIRSRKYTFYDISEESSKTKEEPAAAPVKSESESSVSDVVSSSSEISVENKDEIRLVISALAIVLAVSAAIVLIVTKEKKK